MATVREKEPSLAQVRTVESSREEAVLCTIKTMDGQTIITDEPPERGGTGTAASPLMHFTASLAACQTVQIVKVAEAMRFNHGAINIKAETTTDRVVGIEGKDERVMRFCGAKMIIDIETDEPPKRLERLQQISEDRCPVGNLFTDAGYEPEVVWNALPMPK